MISIRSVEKTSNKDVTSFYMDTIFEAAGNIDSVEWFDFDYLPEKKDQVIVTTEIEAIKLLFKGYRKIGIWEQGILPEESFLRNSSKIRLKVLEAIEKKVLKNANVIIAVSNEMIVHFKQKYGIDVSNKAVTMPCFNTLLADNAFSDTNRYKKRIFCYAGSLAPWQCFDETLRLYSGVEKEYGDSELRIFTRETEEAERRCNGMIKNYSIKSCTNEELQDELKHVTYGFIVRNDIAVNRVATPTKISSYLGNGVIPIYTRCLRGFDEATFGINSFCRLESTDDLDSLLRFCGRTIDADEVTKDISAVYQDYYNKEKYVRKLTEVFKTISK